MTDPSRSSAEERAAPDQALAESVWHPDVRDLIRMNQLVRRAIDLAGFETWYTELSELRRCWLHYHLCHFALQAGAGWRTYDEASGATGLLPHDCRAGEPRSFFQADRYPDWDALFDWLLRLSDEGARQILPWFVYLFGIAEGETYRGETPECCNHWWHRDLLDERVVQAILADPRFWSTSMRDDAAVKQATPAKQTTAPPPGSSRARRRP